MHFTWIKLFPTQMSTNDKMNLQAMIFTFSGPVSMIFFF